MRAMEFNVDFDCDDAWWLDERFDSKFMYCFLKAVDNSCFGKIDIVDLHVHTRISSKTPIYIVVLRIPTLFDEQDQCVEISIASVVQRGAAASSVRCVAKSERNVLISMADVYIARIGSHFPRDSGVSSVDVWPRSTANNNNNGDTASLSSFISTTKQLATLIGIDRLELVDVERDVVRLLDLSTSPLDIEDDQHNDNDRTIHSALHIEQRDNRALLIANSPLNGEVAVVCPATNK
jgi:hypothetical protein